MTTIIYGPCGSGKTRNAEELLELFHEKVLQDNFDFSTPIEPNTLYLTQFLPDRELGKFRVIPIEKALWLLKEKNEREGK